MWRRRMWRQSRRRSLPAPMMTRCPRAAARSAAALPHPTSVRSGPAGPCGRSAWLRRSTRPARRPISWRRRLRRPCCRRRPSWRPRLRRLRARPRSACSAAPVSGLGRARWPAGRASRRSRAAGKPAACKWLHAPEHACAAAHQPPGLPLIRQALLWQLEAHVRCLVLAWAFLRRVQHPTPLPNPLRRPRACSDYPHVAHRQRPHVLQR